MRILLGSFFIAFCTCSYRKIVDFRRRSCFFLCSRDANTSADIHTHMSSTIKRMKMFTGQRMSERHVNNTPEIALSIFVISFYFPFCSFCSFVRLSIFRYCACRSPPLSSLRTHTLRTHMRHNCQIAGRRRPKLFCTVWRFVSFVFFSHFTLACVFVAHVRDLPYSSSIGYSSQARCHSHAHILRSIHTDTFTANGSVHNIDFARTKCSFFLSLLMSCVRLRRREYAQSKLCLHVCVCDGTDILNVALNEASTSIACVKRKNIHQIIRGARDHNTFFHWSWRNKILFNSIFCCRCLVFTPKKKEKKSKENAKSFHFCINQKYTRK